MALFCTQVMESPCDQGTYLATGHPRGLGNDQRGDPVVVVTSVFSASLVSEIRRLPPELKALADGRGMTVVFGRGGWFPHLFAEVVSEDIDFLT